MRLLRLALFLSVSTAPCMAMPAPDRELMAEYNRAWRLIGQQRKSEAAALLQQLISRDTTFYRAYADLVEGQIAPLQAAEAESYFQKLIRENPSNSAAHYGLGKLAASQNRSVDAAKYLEECVRLSPERHECYVELAFHVDTENFFREKIAQSSSNAAPYLGLGMYRRRIGKFSEARLPLSTALSILNGKSNPDLEATAVDILVNTYFGTLGNNREALAYARQALMAYEKIGDEPRILQMRSLIAKLHRRLGQREEALAQYKRMVALITEAGHLEAAAEAFLELGLHHRELGDLEAALQNYLQAAAYSKRLPDHHSSYQRVLIGLAEVYAFQGAYEKAIEHYIRLRETPSRYQNNFMMAWSWRGLGDVYLERGDYIWALECHIRSTQLFRADGYHHTAGAGDGRIGLAYQRLGDYGRAREQLEKALRSAREHEDADGQERTLGNLGRLSMETGDHARALTYLQQALALSERTGWLPFRANTLIALGTLYGERGDSQPALEHLQAGLDAARAVKVNHLQVAALTAIAHERFKIGKLDEAESAYREALETANQTGLRETAWRARQGLGQTLERKLRYSEALDHYEAAVQIVESLRSQVPVPELKTSFLSRRTEPYERAIALLYRLHRNDPRQGHARQAFHYAERSRGRAFLDMLAESRARITRGVTPEQQERQAALEAAFSQASRALLRETSPASKKALQQAERRLEEFSWEMRKTNPKYAELVYPEPATPEEVQVGLKQYRATLVQYALGDKGSFVWVVKPGILIMRALPRRYEIEQRVRAYRTLITTHPKGADAIARYQRRAREIYNLLVKPIERHLVKGERLVIVPDGILHYLPFETLMTVGTQEKRQYLLENHTISYAPSASILNVLRQRQHQTRASRKNLLAFGAPIYPGLNAAGEKRSVTDIVRSIYEANGARFSPLPHAMQELSGIAALYAPGTRKVYQGPAATEAAVKREQASEYRLIHFATHAAVDEMAPSRSGIVLSLTENDDGDDGVLQMREILNLSLNADLVVLSACQTGLGQVVRGEGIIGLTQAFIYAGALRLAVSLWEVNDASTAELMTRFHQIIRSGIPPTKALRQAKLEMLHSGLPVYQHPYFWAPFVIVGALP